MNLDRLSESARGIRLYKHLGNDRLAACQLVMFDRGFSAVRLTLLRGSLSGRVEIEPFPDRPDFFADIYTDEDNWVQMVALDRRSYWALKTRWMRCKIGSTDGK